MKPAGNAESAEGPYRRSARVSAFRCAMADWGLRRPEGRVNWLTESNVRCAINTPVYRDMSHHKAPRLSNAPNAP